MSDIKSTEDMINDLREELIRKSSSSDILEKKYDTRFEDGVMYLKEKRLNRVNYGNKRSSGI